MLAGCNQGKVFTMPAYMLHCVFLFSTKTAKCRLKFARPLKGGCNQDGPITQPRQDGFLPLRQLVTASR